MIFPTDIFTDLMSKPVDADTATGLELVEESITAVISKIDDHLTTFKPGEFETNGEIPDGSFGSSDRGPLLAWHHRRAHKVTAATLKGVKQDLIAFRDACTLARGDVQQADDDAAVEVALTRQAVERLTEASTSNHAETANHTAQQDPVTSAPPVLPTTGTTDGENL
ncbi:MAG TPA: hypothetical protein VNT31_16400 [Nocardioides sp.]|nr:hypothetical protein [Nocardioides sp.]